MDKLNYKSNIILEKEYVNILLYVMENYTLLSTRSEEGILFCYNGKIEIHIGIKPNNNFSIGMHVGNLPMNDVLRDYFPIQINHALQGLRFISCGRPLLSKLAINELVQVFDKSIWFNIIVIEVVMSVLACNVIKNVSLGRSFFEIIRLALEQGSNLLSVKLNKVNFRTKSLFWLYLIITVILCNAYKNTNVYNMTTPRLLVPYTKFGQLVTDKFRIYSVATDDNFHNFRLMYLFTKNISNISFHKHELMADQIYLVRSQLLGISDRLTRTNSSFQLQDKFTNYLKHSIMLPNLNQAILNYFKYHEKMARNWAVYGILKQAVALRKYFVETQLILLQQELSKCNQVAVIIPEYMSQAVKHNVSAHKNHVYMGRDKIWDYQLGVHFSGFVSNDLIRRIKSAKESGLFEKWENILSAKSITKYYDTGPAVVSMDGNILVIFVVLLFGYLLAIVGLVLESLKKTFSYLIVARLKY